MKNVIIIGERSGATELLTFDRVETQFATQALANDLNALAEVILANGLKPYVFCPKLKDDLHSYKYIGRFLDKSVTVINIKEMEKILPYCVGVVLVGIPAKAGTEKAFMDETYAPDWINYWIDGKRVGELGIYKAFFAWQNIPIIMTTGCKAACEESRREIYGVQTVEVKSSEKRFYAKNNDSVENIRKRMTESIERALHNIQERPPSCSENPLKIAIEFIREDYLEDFIYNRSIEGFFRKDSRTIEKTIEKTIDLEKFFGRF